MARRAPGSRPTCATPRARLMADDLVRARTALEQELADESILVERRAEVEAQIAQAREHEARLEAALREDLPALSKAQETWFALGGLRERLRGTQSLAAERRAQCRLRRRGSAETPAAIPTSSRPRPTAVREQEQAIARRGRRTPGRPRGGRRGPQGCRGRRRRGGAPDRRAAAGRRRPARGPGPAARPGQRPASPAPLLPTTRSADSARPARRRCPRRARAARLHRPGDQGRRAGRGRGGARRRARGGEPRCSTTSRSGSPRCATRPSRPTATERARRPQGRPRDGPRPQATARARCWPPPTRSPACSARSAALLAVRPGYEAAVAGALGSAADAVVVSDADAAVGGHRPPARPTTSAAPGCCSAGAPAPTTATGRDLPGHATYAADVVECPEDAARRRWPGCWPSVAVVDDLAAGAGTGRRPARRRRGDPRRRLFGAHFASGGSASQPSLIEIQAAVDEAAGQLAEATAAARAAGLRALAARGRAAGGAERVDVALAKLHESDATLAAVAEELGQYGSAGPRGPRRGRAARRRHRRGPRRRATPTSPGLAELEERLATAEDAPDEEPDTDRARAAGRGRPRRPAGRDGRPAGAAHRGGAGPRAARPRRLAAPRPRGPSATPGPAPPSVASGCRGGRAAEAVRSPPRTSWVALERSLAEAATERSARRGGPQRARAGAARRCASALREPRPGARRAGQLRAPRRDGPRPAADAHRAARGARARGARPGPRRPGRRLRPRPAGAAAHASRCPTAPRSRPSRCPSCARSSTSGCVPAERALPMLGRVNPLALEEFSAMEERHKFLTEQLEDLKKTRKDLLDIVREVDSRVEQVFAEAYADVERGLRLDLRPALPRRRGPPGAHRPGRPARHRRRGGGAAPGQEGQAALAALRRRALAGGRGVPGGALQGPALARSTSSTRSRRRSTTPTSAGCWRSTRSSARTPSCW